MRAAWLGDAQAHATGCYRLLGCRAYGGSRERLHLLWSQGTVSGIAGGRQLTMVDSNGQRIKPGRPHHLARARMGRGERRRSMAVRGYVPEKPATQSEGTCARARNYLVSAVVTKPGSLGGVCRFKNRF